MIWAIKNNQRVLAEPKQKAICPICNAEVISKCGNIKIRHWSHKSNKDCDEWYEPESKWHIDWKNQFPKEQQEFKMGRHRADIRTSTRWIIELQNSTISSDNIREREQYYKKMIWLLNSETLCKGLELRNKKNMITFRWKSPPKSWWFANKDIYVDLSPMVSTLKKLLNDYIKGILKHSTPIREEIYYEYYDEYGEHHEVNYPKIVDYIDSTDSKIKSLKNEIKLFQNKIFYIKKIHHNIPCGGWGELLTKEEFLKKFRT